MSLPPLRTAIACAPLLCPPPAFAAPQGLLDDLISVYPYSIQGEMTCNADGSIVYCGEGGGMAVLDSAAVDGMKIELKRFQTGKLAALTCGAVLDPDAVVDGSDISNFDPTEPENLIYVAGGRHGLIAVSADPRADEPNPAQTLDDSGRGDVSNSKNRRWCNAVEILRTEDGTGTLRTYLVALFARQGSNRLRIYPIELARQAFATPGVGEDETALDLTHAEILSLSVENPFQENPAPPPLPTGYDATQFAYASGLAIDDGDGTSTAYIYVALGMHGLARFRIDTTPGSPILDPQLEHGPYFGTGSHYATAHASDMYGHWNVYDTTHLELGHWERPIFTDVAVQDFGGKKRVFATVDHLGWVMFDLSQGQTWDQDLPITHHEGRRYVVDANTAPPVTTVGSTTQVSLFENTSALEERFNYARRIDIVEVTTASGSEPAVLVTAGPRPWRAWEHTYNDGRAVGYIGDPISKLFGSWQANYQETGSGEPTGTTFLYRDSTGTLFSSGPFETGNLEDRYSATEFFDFGGTYSHGPTPQADPDFLFFCAEDQLRPEDGTSEPIQQKYETYRQDMTWGVTPPPAPLIRENEDRPGRFLRSIGYALPNPATTVREEDVLLTGYNDAEFAQNAPLFMDGDELRETVPLSTDPNLFSSGIQFRPEGQFLQTMTVDQGGTAVDVEHWTWGTTRTCVGVQGQNDVHSSVFTLKGLQFGVDAATGDLTSELAAGAYIWLRPNVVDPPADQLTPSRRGAYYGTGLVNAEYDQHIATFGTLWSEGALFTHMAGERRCTYIVPRSSIRLEIEGTSPPTDPGDCDLTAIDPLNKITGTILMPSLHRELDNLADSDPPPPAIPDDTDDDAEEFMLTYGGASAGFPGQVVNIGGAAARWVWVVPAFSCLLDPNNALVSANEWVTGMNSPHDLTVWANKYTHMMTRIYDVTNPAAIKNMPTLIGPDPESSAADLEVIEFKDRWLVFVVDFAGELVVYDIDDLPSYSPGTGDPADELRTQTYARWKPSQEAIGDKLGHNCRGIALDLFEGEAGTQDDQLFVYLAFSRAGLRILEMDGSGNLDLLESIQTSAQAEQIEIQRYTKPDGTAGRRLFVADERAGIRVYAGR